MSLVVLSDEVLGAAVEPGVVVALGSVGAWVGDCIDGSVGEVGGVVVWAYARPNAPTIETAATAVVRDLETFIINLL